jgi:hypothetical protein
VSSASRRGRTAPSSASSPITRLILSLNRSLSATIVSGVSLRSTGSGGQPHNLNSSGSSRVAGWQRRDRAGRNHRLQLRATDAEAAGRGRGHFIVQNGQWVQQPAAALPVSEPHGRRGWPDRDTEPDL